MASIEQWKLSRAWTIWDEAREPDGADEHIERTCTNLCQLKDGLELNGFLDTLIPGRSQEQESMVPSYLQGDLWDDFGSGSGEEEDEEEDPTLQFLQPDGAGSAEKPTGTRSSRRVVVTATKAQKYSDLSPGARKLDKDLFPIFKASIKGPVAKTRQASCLSCQTEGGMTSFHNNI